MTYFWIFGAVGSLSIMNISNLLLSHAAKML